MKKRKDLPEMTPDEIHRLEEIKMYLAVEKIFKVLGDTTTTQDILDNLCTAAGVSINIIKTLIGAMRAANTTVAPSEDEIAVMLYRKDYSVSTICNILDISPNTVYNYIAGYYTRKDREFMSKVKPEFYPQIVKFTELLGRLLYDELNLQ